MPNAAHDVIVTALREQPALLIALLERLTGASVDGPLTPVDSAVRFVKTAEVRPDIVFRGSKPRWILFELQNAIDPEKSRRWLLAAGMMLNETRSMGEVIVMTASRSVARWARGVARIRGLLGTDLTLRPLVLLVTGKQVKALLDEARPELALFAAWAMQHRHGPAARKVVERALVITGRLTEPLRGAQWRAIFDVLSDRMTAFLKKLAKNPNLLPENPAYTEFVSILEARGEARGKVEGRAEGKVEGKQEALFMILAARGLPMSAAARARVRACADLVKLDRWIQRASTAASVDEVLASRTWHHKTAPAPLPRRARRPASRA